MTYERPAGAPVTEADVAAIVDAFCARQDAELADLQQRLRELRYETLPSRDACWKRAHD